MNITLLSAFVPMASGYIPRKSTRHTVVKSIDQSYNRKTYRSVIQYSWCINVFNFNLRSRSYTRIHSIFG